MQYSEIVQVVKDTPIQDMLKIFDENYSYAHQRTNVGGRFPKGTIVRYTINVFPYRPETIRVQSHIEFSGADVSDKLKQPAELYAEIKRITDEFCVNASEPQIKPFPVKEKKITIGMYRELHCAVDPDKWLKGEMHPEVKSALQYMFAMYAVHNDFAADFFLK